MDKIKIKRILEEERKYVNCAMGEADKKNLENSAVYLVQAKLCKDKVYSLLINAEQDEKGFMKMTPETLKNITKMEDNPFAIECQKIYSEGVNYCNCKLGGDLF